MCTLPNGPIHRSASLGTQGDGHESERPNGGTAMPRVPHALAQHGAAGGSGQVGERNRVTKIPGCDAAILDIDGKSVIRLNLTRGAHAYLDDTPRNRDICRLNWHCNYQASRSGIHRLIACRVDLADGVRHPQYLHRVVSGAGKGQWVHAKDGNLLNCTAENLVLLDRSGWHKVRYRRNPTSSGYIGVTHVPSRGGTYGCHISLDDGKRKCLGWFHCAECAAYTYDAGTKELCELPRKRNNIPLDHPETCPVAAKARGKAHLRPHMLRTRLGV